MNYFIFYQEMDLSHYLYNGTFPISIDGGSAWAADIAMVGPKKYWRLDEQPDYIDTTLQSEAVAHDKPTLDEVNNSKKRTFTIRGQKYIVLQRGEFVME